MSNGVIVEGEVPQEIPDGGELDAQELSKAAQWFESEGFPVPPELTLSPGADQGEPETPPEVQEAPEPDVEETPQAKGWETRREGLKAAYATTQSELKNERAYNEALLAVVKDLHAKANGQAPAAQAPPPEPEEEVDIIDAPDIYVQKRIDKALEPYKKAISYFMGKEKQGQQQSQLEQVVGHVEQARIAYEQENPGFVARAKEYQASFVDDLLETGMSKEEATNAFFNAVNGLMMESMRRGRNPILALDRIASRYASTFPAEAPQNGHAQPQVAPPNARAAAGQRVQAAMRAAQSGAARPGPAPGTADFEDGPVTMEKIRQGRVRPQDVRQLLSQKHGIEDFWKIARAAEEEGQ